MKQSTSFFIMGWVMGATGVLFLWGDWMILAGIFFLLWGNNLMNKGMMKQDEEKRYAWWYDAPKEPMPDDDAMAKALHEVWEKNKDARERH